jgi:cytochrome c-type biogenesis protein CcmF
MSVAHFGVGLFVLGVTLVSAFGIEMDRALRPGQSLEIGAYRLEMRELRDVEGPNYSAWEGVIDIRRNGKFIGEVRPQKRQYLVQKNWMTEAGILADWNRDLFVALGDQLGSDVWSVRVQYKPMIRFIWLGALVMALGGLIAATDRRYRVRVRAETRVSDIATESA